MDVCRQDMARGGNFDGGNGMEKPKTPYERASQELNEFRERRIAERRSRPRGTPDRRRKTGEASQESMNDMLTKRLLH